MLFQTSTTVIAIYFTVLSILIAFKEKGEYFPKVTVNYATLSCVFLYIVSIAGLATLLAKTYIAEIPHESEISLVLSLLFIIGMLFVAFSLKEMLRRI
jgi:NADH:ubiquinone oxidoreductase subunit 2 (subunit N)